MQNTQSLTLKCGVEFIWNPDGYWILRNRENITHLQVGNTDKTYIEALQNGDKYLVPPQRARFLLALLAHTGMLEGTEPAKPKPRKFSPLQLLFIRRPLWNPDSFLEQHIDKLRWLWSKPSAWCLLVFLTASLIIGHSQRAEIAHLGQQLWQHQGSGLIIPFGLTTAAVVTLHELGHAFTLKHFGGIVPEIGLLLMCLFPAAYTNSSDAYILPRWQKSLVIGGGILVQLILGAIGLLFWNLSHSGTWLHTGSYLLLCASLLTVAINLNPLARLDGYYLAMALTGINNLRSRAFGFYRDLFTGKPSSEPEHTRPILLLYAPLSLVYIWFVFGFLFLRIFTWCLDTIPVTAGLLLAIWAVYYFFFPEPQST